ncbi:MAG TPA: PaaI family thioesterase [Jatrophihabitantaceae bacterium]|nr:PaaI family thioesterase [Jatrophihabitantaceae bacterium]
MSELIRLPVPQPRAADAREAARDRLGASVRQLLDTVVGTTASAKDIDTATDAIDAINGILGANPAPRPAHDSPFHPLSLVGGSAHPLAPQLRVEQTEDGVTGIVTLGAAFEGGPSLAHGGVLALLFDHSMGAAVYLAGYAAMTRTLDVHYLAPTPLDVELTLDARIERVSGRRVHVHATIATPDVVTASADAIFVTLTSDNLARIFAVRPADDTA